MTEHHFKFLSLKGGCTGLPESTLVKMPHCWKNHISRLINKKKLYSLQIVHCWQSSTVMPVILSYRHWSVWSDALNIYLNLLGSIVFRIYIPPLTQLCRMEFSFFINWTSPFPILGLLCGIFHFYSFKRNFCLQTVDNLIWRRVYRRLIWFCTVCRCPTKGR